VQIFSTFLDLTQNQYITKFFNQDQVAYLQKQIRKEFVNLPKLTRIFNDNK
jgi:hypothetical protein